MDKNVSSSYRSCISVGQFIGRNLEADGMSIISDFIVKYYPNKAEIIYTQILQYKSQTGLFQNQLAWKTVNTVDPITWWRGNFGSSSSELCKLACRILTIPTSSAASERNWSAFSYIHDKKRNRLTSDKVFKLVYIYSNYKLKLSQIEKNNTNFNENEDSRDNIFDNLNERF
jgi:hypothetical protein